jgi:hypothetical protein
VALGPAETPRGTDRAGEGSYLHRLRLLRTRAGGRGPGAPGRWCRHRDEVRKLREYSEVTLVLSPEEAKALGLHALRDRPEAS